MTSEESMTVAVQMVPGSEKGFRKCLATSACGVGQGSRRGRPVAERRQNWGDVRVKDQE